MNGRDEFFFWLIRIFFPMKVVEDESLFTLDGTTIALC